VTTENSSHLTLLKLRQGCFERWFEWVRFRLTGKKPDDDLYSDDEKSEEVPAVAG
jgi:hypothetical protein